MTRTKNVRALLVVLLSVALMIAFMPSAAFTSYAATASKVTKVTKVSPTKSSSYTMTAGKSKTFKVKLSPKNLKSSKKATTIKSSKTSVAKVGKVSYKKVKGYYYAYAKVKAVKAGKATVKAYAKYGKKSTSWKVTVKATSATAVAITGTATNGETLTATLTPSTAKATAYQWYADGVAITGATASTYKLTTSEVGKKITVKVTSGGKEFTSEATAAVADIDLQITEAKQTGGSEITVKFNKAITSADKITVVRGTIAQTVSSTLAADGMSAVLTLGGAIGAADYTITVTPAKAGAKEATATVKGEVAVLKEIKFLSENLVMTDSTNAEGKVIVKGYDQFGKEMKLSGLTPYSTVGTPSYDASTSTITVKAPVATSGTSTTTSTTVPFVVGNKVTVNVVYQNGNTIVQANATLTVAQSAYIKTITFGDLATTNAKLKDAKVTVKNFNDGTYYVPVKAEDQYGNVLTAKQLTAMATGTSKTLYISPDNTTGQYAYCAGFDTLADGTVIMKLAEGSLHMPGTATINMTSVGGTTVSKSITIVDNPYIADLSVSVPELYAGTAAELTVVAKDQDGNSVDLYDYVTAVTAQKAITFSGSNKLAGGAVASITVKDGTLTAKVNMSKKTVTFLYTGAAKGTDIMTIATAKPSVENKTLTVNAKGVPGTIKGVKSDVDTTLHSGTSFDFTNSLEFLDDYGALMSSDDANYPYYSKTQVAGKYTYNVYDSEGNPVANASNVTVAGTYTVKLFNGTATDPVSTKEVKITVAGATYESYSASIAAGDELLYVGKTKNNDKAEVVVKGTDANGNVVKLDNSEFTLTVSDDLDVDNEYISGALKDASAGALKGTATVTVWANDVQVATTTLAYDNAAPVATTPYVEKNDDTVKTDEIEGATGNYAEFDNSYLDITVGADDYYVGVYDQYGQDMQNAKCSFNGKAYENKLVFTKDDTKNVIFVVSSGTKSQTFTVTGVKVAEAAGSIGTYAGSTFGTAVTEQAYTGGEAFNAPVTYSIDNATGLSIDSATGKVTTTAATPAGTYTVTATSAGDNSTATFTVAKKQITAPTAVGSLTYTGVEQTGVADGTGYTVTGGAKTNAGSYNATATLSDTANTEWTDSTTAAKTVAWSIASKAMAASDFTYGAAKANVTSLTAPTNTTGLSFAEKSATDNISVDATSGAITTTTGWAQGSYVITVTSDGSGNYAAGTFDVTVNVAAFVGA